VDLESFAILRSSTAPEAPSTVKHLMSITPLPRPSLPPPYIYNSPPATPPPAPIDEHSSVRLTSQQGASIAPFSSVHSGIAPSELEDSPVPFSSPDMSGMISMDENRGVRANFLTTEMHSAGFGETFSTNSNDYLGDKQVKGTSVYICDINSPDEVQADGHAAMVTDELVHDAGKVKAAENEKDMEDCVESRDDIISSSSGMGSNEDTGSRSSREEDTEEQSMDIDCEGEYMGSTICDPVDS
jgi:hypothetical protein